MTKQGIIVSVALCLAVVILGGFLLFKYVIEEDLPAQNSLVTNFEQCVQAGYPVMESYPRQCRVPSGELFVESVTNPEPKPVVKDGCFVGGCSGQICSENEGAMSTCEYRPEYACYKNATCERQVNGKCGWTQTSSLSACLQLDL